MSALLVAVVALLAGAGLAALLLRRWRERRGRENPEVIPEIATTEFESDPLPSAEAPSDRAVPGLSADKFTQSPESANARQASEPKGVEPGAESASQSAPATTQDATSAGRAITESGDAFAPSSPGANLLPEVPSSDPTPATLPSDGLKPEDCKFEVCRTTSSPLAAPPVDSALENSECPGSTASGEEGPPQNENPAATESPPIDDETKRESPTEIEEVPQEVAVDEIISSGTDSAGKPLSDSRSDLASAPSPPQEKAPRQFRPAPRVQERNRSKPRDSEKEPRTAGDRAAAISVRLRFEKGGYSKVSLLARRSPDYPAQLDVEGTGNPGRLFALQDNWFQDFISPGAGELLLRGAEWVAHLPGKQKARWTLSGREIYVLGKHEELNGYVSTNRLVIGEQHVVLCTEDRIQDVRSAIDLAGGSLADPLRGKGLPDGWAAFSNVVPTKPVAASSTGEILDALRPAPEVELAFVGGIRIGRQLWLEHYPPRIRLRGDRASAGVVRIDGIEAAVDSSGSYVADAWEALGDHTVSWAAGTRTYTISRGAEEWAPWNAYVWPSTEDEQKVAAFRPALCGALVRPPPAAMPGSQPVLVPASNSLLLGRNAGEVAFCRERSDLGAAPSIGFPSFEPVWAVPQDALRSDKRSMHVLRIGKGAQAPVFTTHHQSMTSRGATRQLAIWRDAILNAGRKGLTTEPSDVEAKVLWREYQAAAKALRRKR